MRATRTPAQFQASWRRFCVSAMILLLPACVLHEPRDTVEPPVELPSNFSEAEPAVEDTQPGPDRWWETFADKRLNGLVEQAVDGNFGLRIAWARLRAARAAARIQGAPLYPQVNLDAGVSKSHTVATSAFGSVKTRAERKSASPAVAYEVDLWGRLRSAKTAAELDAEATRADLDSAAMTLAANVANLYFSLAEQRATIELIRQQLETNETFLELVEFRAGQGEATAVDVYQQRQQVAGSKSKLPLAKSRLAVFEHQLAELLGLTPDADVAGDLTELPGLPPLPETGVPAELLRRRPDIRAAGKRVIAADHRLAAAIADRFPSIRLTGSLPFASARTADVFKHFVWNLTAGVSAPILDGGRRAAEVDRNQAVIEQRLNTYASTLLTALREVEDAMVKERRQQEYLQRIADQVETARRTLRETRVRYVNGQGNYLPVLTALRDVQRLELLQITEKKRLLTHRIALYRALGGTWTDDLSPARRGPESNATNEN